MRSREMGQSPILMESEPGSGIYLSMIFSENRCPLFGIMLRPLF
jgi:hypothetical protein